MADQTDISGDELIKKLRKGQLPQMVDWFDPLVLGMVGMRTLISTTIGEYADQRPMQEVVDGERDDEKLVSRHDFSRPDPANAKLILPPDADRQNPNCPEHPHFGKTNPEDELLNRFRVERRLQLDDSGAFWVDFIADLGDGFEATYAMASLLAAEKLRVGGVSEALPAGQVLIFGGDLAYPNATVEEYRNRCLNPYEWAYTADQFKLEPTRELFFVAGNHDWYDGLSAFTEQFCYDASSVGGWRCKQERSYFALRLPHDWWIWGVDVALGDHIDVGQLHYFQAIVRSISESQNPKILIILHAPDWTKPSYKALTRICELAREKGEVCAIIAGDLHHYSRYQSLDDKAAAKSKTLFRDQPMHLITSGGGGAFAHPTHDRKKSLDIEPAVVTRRLRGAAGSQKYEQKEAGSYRFRAQKFYPSRTWSRVIALKNLWLPFHNWRFALLLGFVYLLYAWVFSGSAPQNAPAAGAAGMKVADAAAVATAARNSPAFFFMLLGLWLGLVLYVEADLKSRFLRWLNGPIKLVFGTLHYSAHITALLYVSALSTALATNILNPIIGTAILYARVLTGELLQGLLWSGDREAQLRSMWNCLDRLDWSAPGTWTCVTAPSNPDAVYIALTALSFAATSIVIGGLIGGFIFGCYWVITSVPFGMHPDAFSALAIKDYKNFLRMKFEKGKLTIYPIALDHVPGRRDWRPWNQEKDIKNAALKHRPLILPKTEMQPRLIEGPIGITRAEVPRIVEARSIVVGRGDDSV